MQMFGEPSASFQMKRYSYTYSAGAEAYSRTWSTGYQLVNNRNIAESLFASTGYSRFPRRTSKDSRRARTRAWMAIYGRPTIKR